VRRGREGEGEGEGEERAMSLIQAQSWCGRCQVLPASCSIRCGIDGRGLDKR
jgi:hypothetical protein